MNTQICITEYESRVLTALYENDVLAELWLQDGEEIRVGDIYVGKIKNVVPNLRAAFVEFASGKMGYYQPEEHVPICFLNQKKNDKMASGDEILVQVAAEPLKSKEWKLSGRIRFAGQWAVYEPLGTLCSVSAKIRDPETRRRLQALTEHEDAAKGGWTIRTAAAKAEDDEILAEMKKIAEQAQKVLDTAKMRSCYSRVYRGMSLAQELLLRCAPECSVTTDIRSVYDELTAVFPGKIRLYEDKSWPLLKLKGLEAELERALGKAVWLPSGGRLFIEQTEAMTVIDVNSGKAVGKNQREAQFFRVNTEAVRESLRQIRLRNLSGIIMIDLINMKNKEHIEAIAGMLKEQSVKDPVQTTFVDITGLQIAELTRKKVRRTLKEQMRKPKETA